MNEAVRLGFEPFLGWPLFWGLAGLTAAAWAAYLALRGRAWLTRALECSCVSQEGEFVVVTNRSGGFSVVDGVLQQHQQEEVQCAITQHILTIGMCRQELYCCDTS